jgi:hypothetical protein
MKGIQRESLCMQGSCLIFCLLTPVNCLFLSAQDGSLSRRNRPDKKFPVISGKQAKSGNSHGGDHVVVGGGLPNLPPARHGQALAHDPLERCERDHAMDQSAVNRHPDSVASAPRTAPVRSNARLPRKQLGRHCASRVHPPPQSPTLHWPRGLAGCPARSG